MKRAIYSFTSYRDLILDLISNRPNEGRGVRKALADALDCQMAFITHVLCGEKEFNHEQILKIARYFNLVETEREYLLDLLSFNRAGTKDLRSFYEQRLELKRKDYRQLKNRLQETQSLSIEHQAQYYSHWLYGAIHMASTVPSLQSVEAVANHFNLEDSDLLPILELLSSQGLIAIESGKIGPGKANLYVGNDSPLVNQHHTIWRLKSLNDLKAAKTDALHYSLCFSAAQSDWPVIRETLLEAINNCLAVIRPSKEEKLGLICVDFQEV